MGTQLPGCAEHTLVAHQASRHPHILLPAGESAPSLFTGFAITLGLYPGEPKASLPLLLGHLLEEASPTQPAAGAAADPYSKTPAYLIVCGCLPQDSWERSDAERFLVAVPLVIRKGEIRLEQILTDSKLNVEAVSGALCSPSLLFALARIARFCRRQYGLRRHHASSACREWS